MPAAPLTRIVAWAQRLAAEVLVPGDLAVDLTAGSGRDTLFLWQQVAPGGRVLAFDIQPAALAETSQRLTQEGVPHWILPASGEQIGEASGVYLTGACHSRLEAFLPPAPRVILANLGFHPGGDTKVVTRPESTLAALKTASRLLAPGGRLLVAVYSGHAGGEAESQSVKAWFTALVPRDWDVLHLSLCNRPVAPELLAAQRRNAAEPQ